MQQTVSVILRLVNQFSGPAKRAGGSIGSLIKGMAFLNQAAELVARSVGGIARAFKGLTDDLIQSVSQFKNIQIGIAGTLKAFDLVPTFKAGQGAAKGLYAYLEELAAPLPGSVDDFVAVFQRALPKSIEAFQQKGKGSLKDIASFTSRFAAVAIANNIDARQAAADLPRLLGGAAGLDVIAYQKMSGLFSKAAKSIGLAAGNAKEFNKLNPAQRLDVLQKVISMSGSTIDAFGGTIDAASGTLDSVTAKLKRLAGQAVYDAQFRTLKAVTGLLEANLPMIQNLATLVGDTLAGGFDFALNAATRLGQTLAGVPLLSDLFALLTGGAGGLGTILGQAGGFIGDVVFQAIESFGTMLGAAVTLLTPVFAVLSSIVGITVAQFQAVIAYIGAFVGTIADLAMPALGYLAHEAGVLFDALRPLFADLVEYGKQLGTALGKLLAPLVSIGAVLLGGLVRILSQYVVPTIRMFGAVLGLFIGIIARFANWVASIIPGMSRVRPPTLPTVGGSTQKAAGGPDFLGRDLFAGMKGLGAAAQAKKGSGKRKGTTFDFRGSRFDITQKFAEGYDPDRIAVAFAGDLARLGEMRAQSNLAPVFALR